MGLSSNELAARIALLKKDRAMSTEMMEEKCASSREKALNLFKRLGKNKEFVIVGKPGADIYDTNDHIWRAVRQQHPIKAVRGAVRKLRGKEGLKAFDESLRGVADTQTLGALGGTIAPGRKGTKSYISRGVASGDRSGMPGLREVLHHEGFHAKVPILGSSEILAHAYGGLKSKKGRLDPAQGVNALKHLWATRPGRAIFEAGVGAGVVGGGGAALASHVKKRTDKKEVGSAKTTGLNTDAASLESSIDTGAGERLTKKAFWQGFEKRAQHNKEAVLLAGGVHVLQNALMRNKIRSPKFAKTVASEFQQGLANKAPSKMKQFFRSMVGGATVPEASMVREHVRHLGDEARKNLVEHGVKSLGKKEMLLARVVSKGDFHKLLDDRYFNKNNPAHQAILKTVEGRIGAKITPENAEALSKAWKSKDSPITSNLLSGITRGPGQSVGGRLHIPQHTGSTVSHGASLAGHVAGGAVTGLVDPLTGAMNASKSILTNPISRGWLSKIKGGAKALAGSDKMFMSDPIAKGKAMGLAGKEIPKAEKLVRGYGLNAATSEMQNTANSLSLAAHGAKNPSSMAAAPASPIVRRPLPLVQPHMGLTPMGLGGFNGV